ncbi:MAG: small multi-drug export protein [Flavobacteriales bacterium]|nr:small multi-drug export protein [Flavobacteriales bacterium]MCB9363786.1 small multi-drug export protein [Flavobacteriales bacterium]
MLAEFITTFLISVSPLGEARVGIPYGVMNDIPVGWAFLVGWLANLLVFPIFFYGIRFSNKTLWKSRVYKKSAVYLSKRAKRKTKNSIDKYGLWGLMVFVMIPLPITGAYIGTLAAYILGMDYKKSFFAVTVGVTISSVIIASGMYFGTSI